MVVVQKTRRVKTPKKKKIEPTPALPAVVNTCSGCGVEEMGDKVRFKLIKIVY